MTLDLRPIRDRGYPNDRPIAEAADRLFAAAASGVLCAPVRDLIVTGDIDGAYAIQEINTQRAVTAGRRIVGRKVGLTSPAVQRQMGVNQPDFGILFDDMAAGEGLPIDWSRVMQPKIEAEVALILASDLDCERLTLADVIRATAYALPALEIVGSRILGWDIGIVDTIADNASSGLFVLGGPARGLEELDLRSATMVMRRHAEVVSEGSGSACLGHPLNAAAWLAGEMARRGRPLRAGDIVLTGALGPMVAVNPGDHFEAHISGLGRVSALFGWSARMSKTTVAIIGAGSLGTDLMIKVLSLSDTLHMGSMVRTPSRSRTRSTISSALAGSTHQCRPRDARPRLGPGLLSVLRHAGRRSRPAEATPGPILLEAGRRREVGRQEDLRFISRRNSAMAARQLEAAAHLRGTR